MSLQLLHLLPLLLLAVAAGRSQALRSRAADAKKRQCQPITIPLCRGIGYNMTYMPNEFNHETQEEAGLEVHQFWPLVYIECSPDLRFFLCSMYTPICMGNYEKHLPVCREVCEQAQAGCGPLMRRFGFRWPDRLACDKLPRFGEEICMSDHNRTRDRTTARPGGPRPGGARQQGRGPNQGPGGGRGLGLSTASPGCSCACREPMVRITDRNHQYFNRVSTGGELNCAAACYSAFFPAENREFATFWLGVWSILCCVSTLVTVATFLVDMQRFKYPERPIIYLSFCYLMISVGFVLRLVLGHQQVACDGALVRQRCSGPVQCSLVFLLIYFFSMASSLWWVVLTVTWFLAAGLKWGSEAIAKYSQVYHFVAWFLPGAKSIIALAISAVDGDNVGGICYVGNTSLFNLRLFLLGPLFLYLLLGLIFLLSGFVSLFRIRSVIKAQGEQKIDKLEKLMVRIGIFSVLYCVPATVQLACYFYEQHLRPEWERAHNCPPCGRRGAAPGPQPEYAMFMLKYFMSLVVGITSGFWVWTGKTLDSWRAFLARLGCVCCYAGARGRHRASPQHQLLTNVGAQAAPVPPQAPVPVLAPCLGPGVGAAMLPLPGAPPPGLAVHGGPYGAKYHQQASPSPGGGTTILDSLTGPPSGSLVMHSQRQKLLSSAATTMSHV